MIVQQTLPHIPVRIYANSVDKSWWFDMGNKGHLIDQYNDDVWDGKKQILSLKGIDYFPQTVYDGSFVELVKYFGNLLCGDKQGE